MKFTVDANWDDEAGVWFAVSREQVGHKVAVDSSIRSRHTANGVLKQAGLPKVF